MDGTLLDSQKKISHRNKEALISCIEKGIHIVPTTGRAVDGIPVEIWNLPGVRYAITTNGAVIKDKAQEAPIFTAKLANEAALKIMMLMKQFRVIYDPFIEGRGITENRFYDHLDEYGLSPQMQELVRKTRDVVPDSCEYVKNCNKEVEKINLFFSSQQERSLVRARLMEIPDIIISSSLPNNLEINASGATKGAGILRLADHLGLSIKQTMAFGDGENDVSMIQTAGLSVVMENGEPFLKEMADYITSSNDKDGVAKAIERFVFMR